VDRWRATLARCKSACRELALDNGADGVGLLRIEQLYFARNTPPSEVELFVELKQLVAPLRQRETRHRQGGRAETLAERP
jgi:phosphoenolpyruvate-protein kinase (PTS system EI component)